VNTISLDQYGGLHFREDYWFCEAAPTLIGAVDAQVDACHDLPAASSAWIVAVLDRIEQVNADAQAYLQKHAPDDFERATPLRNPSLLFGPEAPLGAFTIFYSGADEDDEMCYGVQFEDFVPIDVTIGD
jgi:hypothetical protein